MTAEFAIAQADDYEDVIDLGNYVFSHARGGLDFPSLLPKLYKREYFMEGLHYVAREEGKIKAVIGAYPLMWEFPGAAVPGRGIGMVSVHPYCRSKGYMKALMGLALDDMKRDGVVFSVLGGQRQRYEYFGYTPAGGAYTFTCSEANILHTVGRCWEGAFSLKPVESPDTALLDQMYALHNAKPIRIRRDRDRFFDILSSWKAQVFAVFEGPDFYGYLLCTGGGGRIGEIVLKDYSRLAEAVGLVIGRRKEAGQGDSVEVLAGPYEREKIQVLSRFAESYTQSAAYQCRVFDYLRFIEPFLTLQFRRPQEGSFVLQIKGGVRIRLFVREGKGAAEETPAPPDITLDPFEALHFLTSPMADVTFPVLGEKGFPRSLLPLPLFFEPADHV
jgi:predicted N-acetyltransferase YhbS